MSDKPEDMTPFEQKVVAAGHVLKRDEDGRVDSWVMSYDVHNGPGCAVCDDSWCEHCRGPVEPCDGGEAKREGEKHARMVAAAPDLLAAALASVAPYAESADASCPPYVLRLRAAIAKATGS